LAWVTAPDAASLIDLAPVTISADTLIAVAAGAIALLLVFADEIQAALTSG
jgi:hypothetical protein